MARFPTVMDAGQIDAGTLSARVAILAPRYANEYEDEIDGYEQIGSAWAAISQRDGSETNESGRTVAITQTLICIRARTDIQIDKRCRIQDYSAGAVYQIEGILNPSRRGISMILTCRQIE